MRKIFIWGASGHARVVAEIVRLNNEFALAGFIDNTESAPNEFLGVPVHHTVDTVEKGASVVIAIGGCEARTRLAFLASAHGLVLTSLIHPRAIISDTASIGAGTVIAAGAIVNPGCIIGENVIVNTGATVDHDCSIAAGVHIGPGAHLGGWVSVGPSTWLGIGAIVRDRVSIGANSVIGAGSVVLSDIADGVVAFGVPAKAVKEIVL